MRSSCWLRCATHAVVDLCNKLPDKKPQLSESLLPTTRLVVPLVGTASRTAAGFELRRQEPRLLLPLDLLLLASPLGQASLMEVVATPAAHARHTLSVVKALQADRTWLLRSVSGSLPSLRRGTRLQCRPRRWRHLLLLLLPQRLLIGFLPDLRRRSVCSCILRHITILQNLHWISGDCAVSNAHIASTTIPSNAGTFTSAIASSSVLRCQTSAPPLLSATSWRSLRHAGTNACKQMPAAAVAKAQACTELTCRVPTNAASFRQP
mmetsp:Transcript_22251/g.40903  ORF Transcript_22251/g.40903 Transcript_22251/m.40903 type:complete len:265 (+) Transcript_22251:1-795(+)